MKSREAFNPSKPFVFPPVIKSTNTPSGCGKLFGGMVVVVIGISAIMAVAGMFTSMTSPASTSAPAAPATATPVPAPTPDTNAVAVPPTPPPESGSSLSLKDDSSFPATVVISTHADIVTSTGGFGLDPGDEVMVDSRQPDGSYVISHGGQQSTVTAKLIDDAKVK